MYLVVHYVLIVGLTPLSISIFEWLSMRCAWFSYIRLYLYALIYLSYIHILLSWRCQPTFNYVQYPTNSIISKRQLQKNTWSVHNADVVMRFEEHNETTRVYRTNLPIWLGNFILPPLFPQITPSCLEIRTHYSVLQYYRYLHHRPHTEEAALLSGRPKSGRSRT